MKTTPSRSLPTSLLATPVHGRHLRGPTLADNLTPDPTLLVFLRHLG